MKEAVAVSGWEKKEINRRNNYDKSTYFECWQGY
jgi:hypothetical protein